MKLHPLGHDSTLRVKNRSCLVHLPIRRLVFILALTNLACASVFALPPFGKTKDLIIATLTSYQEKEGFLPYDPKGAPNALYRLVDYTKGLEVTSSNFVWYIESLHLTLKITETLPRFDHKSRQMLDCPYEYINAPNTRIAPADDPIVILARIDKSGGRSICEYITSSAQYFKVVLRDVQPTANELLGLPGAAMPALVTEVIDVCIDDPEQWLHRTDDPDRWINGRRANEDTVASCARRDFKIPYDTLPEYLDARIGIERMFQAFAFYSRDMGSLPYDSRGADYALYKLKPYFPQVNNRTNRLHPPIQFDDKLGRVTSDRYYYINRDQYRFDQRNVEIILVDLQRYPLDKSGVSLGYSKGDPVNRALFSFGQSGLLPAFDSTSVLDDPNAQLLVAKGQLISRYFQNWWEGRDRFDAVTY